MKKIIAIGLSILLFAIFIIYAIYISNINPNFKAVLIILIAGAVFVIYTGAFLFYKTNFHLSKIKEGAISKEIKIEEGEDWKVIPPDKEIVIKDQRNNQTYLAIAYKEVVNNNNLRTLWILGEDGIKRYYKDVIFLADNPFSIWKNGHEFQVWKVGDNVIQEYEQKLNILRLQKQKLLKELKDSTKTFEEAYAERNKLMKSIKTFGSFDRDHESPLLPLMPYEEEGV